MRYFCPDPQEPDDWMELGDFPDYRSAEEAYYKYHDGLKYYFTADPLLLSEQDVARLTDLMEA